MPETEMPDKPTEQPKSTPKPKAAAPKTIKLPFATYSYPCALCGKSTVGWTVTGLGVIKNEDWVAIPLKHEICGQEITLDIKQEELG